MERRVLLLIDDDPSTHHLVKFHLEGVVDVILSAMDAEEGLELARERHPDLILMDLQMPGMDGLSACRALKAEEKTARIPILFLSGEGDSGGSHALDQGAIDYISKPFDTAEFQARVRAALRAGPNDRPPSSLSSVLVIDDDESIHKLLDIHLEGVPRILHARGPMEGIVIAQREIPDVILLNLDLPVMDGFRVCRKLKSDERTRKIPVVFLTADGNPHRIATGLDSGAVDYLVKPIEKNRLAARLRAALRR